MRRSLLAGGGALVAAALLTLTRMIPVFVGGNIDPRHFPPHTATDIAAVTTADGHLLSHAMALAASPLLLFGLLIVYRALASRHRVLPLAWTVALATGLVLYTVAIIVDGFITPLAVDRYLTATTPPTRETAEALVTLTHQAALSFFAPAMLFVMLGVALLGAGLLRLRVHPRLLGIPGAALGTVFAAGYVTGVFGLRLQEHFGLVGVLLTAMGLWFLVLGVAVIRWSRHDSTARAGRIAARG